MRLHKFLEEALKPSQYRPYVKGWDKSKYEKLFNGKYRIYLELEKTKEDERVNPKIQKVLSDLGYEIENYAAGLCKKKGGKNPVRIGKILQKGMPDILKEFINDPIRNASKKNDLMVVISRHPYDIAGMSTDRGWTSCMDMDREKSHDSDANMCGYLPAEIKEGSLVAYLIAKDDKNINAPIARITLKPYINQEDPTKKILVPGKIYGTGNIRFRRTVIMWLGTFQKNIKGEYKIAKDVYRDKLPELIKIKD
jgi:hypothetical protein